MDGLREIIKHLLENGIQPTTYVRPGFQVTSDSSGTGHGQNLVVKVVKAESSGQSREQNPRMVHGDAQSEHRGRTLVV